MEKVLDITVAERMNGVGEYYFSKKIWPVFLVAGIGIIIGSLWIKEVLPAAILGVLGCSCQWSIQELFEQEQRVKKGWFPANPNKSIVVKEKSENERL